MFNNSVYINQYWHSFRGINEYVHYVAIVFYTLVGLFGAFGNIMMIVYHLYFEKVVNSISYLMVNLAIADLILIFGNLPFVAYNSACGGWCLGQIGCNIYGTLGSLFGFGSISLMVLISIERLVTVSNYTPKIANRKTVDIACLIGAWLYSIIWSVLPIFGPHQYVPDGFGTSCTFDYLSTDIYTRIILLLMTIFGFVIPVIIISTAYIFILKNIKSHHNNLQLNMFQMENSNNRYNSINTATSSEQSEILLSLNNFHRRTLHSISSNEMNRSEIQQMRIHQNSYAIYSCELKITKTIILIVFCYLFTWLPYTFVSSIGQFHHNRAIFVTPYTTYLTTLLVKLSVIINPVVYAMTNRKFRIRTKYFIKKVLNLKTRHIRRH